MEFRNNFRLSTGLWMILFFSCLISCKKNDDQVSYFFDSSPWILETGDESQTPPSSSSSIEAFFFPDFSPSQSAIYINGGDNDLVWRRAQRTFDFSPLNGAPGIDDDSRTQARFLTDGNRLYILISCWDRSLTYTGTAVNSGSELRNQADVVSVFIDPNGDNQDVYCLQVTPDYKRTECVYANGNISNIGYLQSIGNPVNVSTYYYPYNPNDNSGNFAGWRAEISIPFNAAYSTSVPFSGFGPVAMGTTTWKVNIVRQNFRSNGAAAPIPQGKYAMINPGSIESSSSLFQTLHFNSNNIIDNPFSIGLRGLILSAGPIHAQEYGFTGYAFHRAGSTITPINISLGPKVNPGIISATERLQVGDSLVYKAYIIGPDGTKRFSNTLQKHLIQ